MADELEPRALGTPSGSGVTQGHLSCDVCLRPPLPALDLELRRVLRKGVCVRTRAHMYSHLCSHVSQQTPLGQYVTPSDPRALSQKGFPVCQGYSDSLSYLLTLRDK